MADGDQSGDSNGPKKMKLLLDEVFGVRTSAGSSRVQLVARSTTPNQNNMPGPNENVQNDLPTLKSPDGSASVANIQDLSSAESEENSAPAVLDNGNGTVMEETVGQPQDASEINADLSHSITAEPDILQREENNISDFSNTGDPSSADSTPEVVIQQNGVPNPPVIIDSSDGNQRVTADVGDPEVLPNLARAAAERMLNIQDESVATTEAAGGIAAAPLEAQMQQEADIIERGRNLPGSEVFVRRAENLAPRRYRNSYSPER